MNTHKAMKLPFGFLAVALISMSSPAVLTAARPLQIIWEQTAQEGGTFSVDFWPSGEKSTENVPPSWAVCSQMICSGRAAVKTAGLLILMSATAKKPKGSFMALCVFILCFLD